MVEISNPANPENYGARQESWKLDSAEREALANIYGNFWLDGETLDEVAEVHESLRRRVESVKEVPFLVVKRGARLEHHYWGGWRCVQKPTPKIAAGNTRHLEYSINQQKVGLNYGDDSWESADSFVAGGKEIVLRHRDDTDGGLGCLVSPYRVQGPAAVGDSLPSEMFNLHVPLDENMGVFSLTRLLHPKGFLCTTEIYFDYKAISQWHRQDPERHFGVLINSLANMED